MLRKRRTKILATVGPASASPHMLKKLFNAGVDTFRLNFSHGKKSDHAVVIKHLRALELEVGIPIGILQDLQGPKIRLGDLNNGEIEINPGDVLSFSPVKSCGNDDLIPLPHPEIFLALKEGDRIFIDDGRISMKAIKISSNILQAEVIGGKLLKSRKGVNLPDCVLDLPVLTEKDHSDLKFGLENDVDWVALSFVQRASDMVEISKIVAGRAGIVAKIEKPTALDEIEGIVEHSDAIMIARGDLGVEILPEAVPAYQKEIIALCRSEAKPVIVATQMLESMTDVPAPTRAEASDVATAVYDGADAVMLSAESATGKFPVEAVTVMDRIIHSTEHHEYYERQINASKREPKSNADVIADTGASLACLLQSRCIVAYSRSGATARCVSARRPALPLFVLTKESKVSRQMALIWGARSVLEKNVDDYETMVSTARDNSMRLMDVKSGNIVVLAGVPFGQSGNTNNIRVVKLS